MFPLINPNIFTHLNYKQKVFIGKKEPVRALCWIKKPSLASLFICLDLRRFSPPHVWFCSSILMALSLKDESGWVLMSIKSFRLMTQSVFSVFNQTFIGRMSCSDLLRNNMLCFLLAVMQLLG